MFWIPSFAQEESSSCTPSAESGASALNVLRDRAMERKHSKVRTFSLCYFCLVFYGVLGFLWFSMVYSTLLY